MQKVSNLSLMFSNLSLQGGQRQGQRVQNRKRPRQEMLDPNPVERKKQKLDEPNLRVWPSTPESRQRNRGRTKPSRLSFRLERSGWSFKNLPASPMRFMSITRTMVFQER